MYKQLGPLPWQLGISLVDYLGGSLHDYLRNTIMSSLAVGITNQ